MNKFKKFYCGLACLIGLLSSGTKAHADLDIDLDHKTGLPEVVYSLQVASGIEQGYKNLLIQKFLCPAMKDEYIVLVIGDLDQSYVDSIAKNSDLIDGTYYADYTMIEENPCIVANRVKKYIGDVDQTWDKYNYKSIDGNITVENLSSLSKKDLEIICNCELIAIPYDKGRKVQKITEEILKEKIFR